MWCWWLLVAPPCPSLSSMPMGKQNIAKRTQFYQMLLEELQANGTDWSILLGDFNEAILTTEWWQTCKSCAAGYYLLLWQRTREAQATHCRDNPAWLDAFLVGVEVLEASTLQVGANSSRASWSHWATSEYCARGQASQGLSPTETHIHRSDSTGASES